jgi:hypothetical protein
MPDFDATAGKIKDRARIKIGAGGNRTIASGTVTKDPYVFDGSAKRFNP